MYHDETVSPSMITRRPSHMPDIRIPWTPYNILVLIKSITACSWYIPQELWDFFYYLCYINSTVNPMCYALCNAAFRRTYVRILKCKWHNRNRAAIDRG